MQRISIILSTLLFVLLFTVSSCSEKDKGGAVPTGSSSDRELMLTNIADNIIIPAYANFDLKLANMIAKSDAFRANPTTTTLTEYRTAWEEAYIAWQKIALFDFGPATDNGLQGFMNIYPTNITTINANITSGTASLETFGSYAAQGFPALDYMINGIAATGDDAIITLYSTDSDADKRKAYLLKLTNQMRTKFDLVNNAWKGTYRNVFVANAGTGMYSSTSLMVNGVVFYYERYLRSGKFGIPSGRMTGTSISTSVEAYYSKEVAKTLAQTAHQAFVDFFNGKGFTTGTEGASLKTYLNSLGAKDATTQVLLSEKINTQFGVVNDKLGLLTSENLSNEVSANNATMIAVFDEMQLVIKMLKVDMTSAMSITITYTDNDGD